MSIVKYYGSEQPRNLHATEDTIRAAGQKAESKVPARFNRQAQEAKHCAMIEFCKKKATPISGYKPGDYIAYVRYYNRGTKKYPDIIPTVQFGTITKINPKTVTADGSIVQFGMILGTVTKRKRNTSPFGMIRN